MYKANRCIYVADTLDYILIPKLFIYSDELFFEQEF